MHKIKKRGNLSILSFSVGITGLEPATSRPPEVYQLGLNPVDNQYYTDYLCFKSDGFRDGFHHVLLNFNISISHFGTSVPATKL